MHEYFAEALKVRLQDYLMRSRKIGYKFEDNGGGREPMDEVDLAASRYEEDFMLHMQQRSQQFILEITQALQRIESGDFGICEECGDDIGVERLKAQPTTRVCIHCKQELESAERRKLGKMQGWKPLWPLEIGRPKSQYSTKEYIARLEKS